MIELHRGLRFKPGTCLAFAGAGGKTSALFHLARQLPPPVFVTTTTHLGVDQIKLADICLTVTDAAQIGHLIHINLNGVIAVVGALGNDQRVQGLDAETALELMRFADKHGISLLIESDGARLLPAKAPAEREPVIPEWVDTVVVVAGLSALGKPLDERHVHRPERFARLSGLQPSEAITPHALVAVLSHPEGGLKGIPATARRMVLLNQADTLELHEAGKEIAGSLLASFDSVVITSFQRKAHPVLSVHERVAGIILAAGGSERYGKPKILLDWKGETFIRRVAKIAIEAGLSPLVVVAGAVIDPLFTALEDLPVNIIVNERWQEGQSTSVKAALQHLPKSVGAAVFMLADQPHIPLALIKALIEKHANTLAAVIAPCVAGERANPVLWDADTFASFAELSGDTGGRALMERYPLTCLKWDDPAILLDVDTPADYDLLLSGKGRRGDG